MTFLHSVDKTIFFEMELELGLSSTQIQTKRKAFHDLYGNGPSIVFI